MTPLYNRMVAAMAGEAAPPEPPPDTPESFTATHQMGDCPELNVKLTWSNAGHDEAKVLEYSQDGSTGWTQIATPGVADEEYLHEGVDAGADDEGHWRIRWQGEATWANTSTMVICPE